MDILEVKTEEVQVLEALNGLLPQLSEAANPISAVDLGRIIDAPSSHLLMARDGDAYIGSLTLILFDLPTGMRARIEDLVVDRAARGKGAGKALVSKALELARAAGADAVDLTSNPSRTSANGLYRRMGFEQRRTNVYAMQL